MARLPATAHTDQPWRIHQIASDFRVEDVWSFRMPGAGPHDFHEAVHALQRGAGLDRLNLPSRALFAIRWRLGALLGWDDPTASSDLRSLRMRLPDDLQYLPEWASQGAESTPMSMVYLTSDEAVEELTNRIVHALMHLGWVPGPDGDYELRMAALVKPLGTLSSAYMAAIQPLRYAIVYPSLTRTWERAWLQRHAQDDEAPREVESHVGSDQVPAEIRRTFPGRADYADAFRLPVTEHASAEDWARAMFGDEPSAASYIVGTLLGERVTPGRSPETIGGNRIAGRGADWVRMESPSWLLSGATVVHAADQTLTLAVFQRYDKALGLGRLVWGALSPVHRRLAPPTLRRARKTLRTRRGTAVPAEAAAA